MGLEHKKSPQSMERFSFFSSGIIGVSYSYYLPLDTFLKSGLFAASLMPVRTSITHCTSWSVLLLTSSCHQRVFLTFVQKNPRIVAFTFLFVEPIKDGSLATGTVGMDTIDVFASLVVMYQL